MSTRESWFGLKPVSTYCAPVLWIYCTSVYPSGRRLAGIVSRSIFTR